MFRDDFSLHSLSGDERATGQSMLSRESTGRLLVMPTHHFGDYGDFTGFRYDCGATAVASCLPVSRRMFYGHTLVECLDGEAAILKLMSQPAENRKIMRDFMLATAENCSPALLDCIPDNSDALTGHGVLQAFQKIEYSRTFYRCKINFNFIIIFFQCRRAWTSGRSTPRTGLPRSPTP